MKTADVSDHRPLERPHIVRRRRARRPRRFEPLEVDAEREQMDPIAEPCRSLTEALRRDEHEVGLAEQPLLARHDASCRRRTRREIVDAVIDRQLRIERRDQIARERCREECPDDRAVHSRGPHPAAQRPHEQRPVHPPRQPEIRPRQDQRRIHEQVRPLLAKSFRPAPPVPDALAQARQVSEVGCTDSRVLDKQHALPVRREPRHDLLVPLPDEVPVDRRDADDVWESGQRFRQGHWVHGRAVYGSRRWASRRAAGAVTSGCRR